MSGNAQDSDDAPRNHFETADAMAQALLNVEEDDVVKLSFKFVDDGEREATTQQRVEDIAESGPVTKIHMEECRGWNGPSVTLIVFHELPTLKPVLKHPTADPTPVREFTELEVNPDD